MRYTATGEIFDKYLRKELELDELVAHHLFSANRWEIKELIENLLGAHHPVILDRYVALGIAYKAAKGKFSIEFCNQFNVGLP
jgi:dTMP kinase